MDKNRVQKLRKIIEARETKEAHRMLRLVSGLGRFRIITLLKKSEQPLNVTTVATILRRSCSAISHELRVLRKHGLVESSASGREVYYSVVTKALRHIR
jgi:DNA-binding transcriptional ArsR family regulator